MERRLDVSSASEGQVQRKWLGDSFELCLGGGFIEPVRVLGVLREESTDVTVE